mmetsp:Transcript_56113/g.111086  ORF Transcript_56113/g.111086 Transcript_56113/m.111086 type:complete len:289 (+) Transcript_56113:212-1078(+)
MDVGDAQHPRRDRREAGPHGEPVEWQTFGTALTAARHHSRRRTSGNAVPPHSHPRHSATSGGPRNGPRKKRGIVCTRSEGDGRLPRGALSELDCGGPRLWSPSGHQRQRRGTLSGVRCGGRHPGGEMDSHECGQARSISGKEKKAAGSKQPWPAVPSPSPSTCVSATRNASKRLNCGCVRGASERAAGQRLRAAQAGVRPTGLGRGAACGEPRTVALQSYAAATFDFVFILAFATVDVDVIVAETVVIVATQSAQTPKAAAVTQASRNSPLSEARPAAAATKAARVKG